MLKKSLTKKALFFLFNVLLRILSPVHRLLINTHLHYSAKSYLLKFKGRPDDIYIVSFAKSGSTRMQMIMYQLTTEGNMDFQKISQPAPFLEDLLKNDSAPDHLPSPRIFKTHLPYHVFPANIPGRFIYLVRDGKDVAVSLYHHLKPMFEINAGIELTFDRSFHMVFLNEPNHIRPSFYKGWFEHLADWLANKKNFNILYIKYEHLVKDFERSIQKIAAFCKLTIREADRPRIIERCSFNFMKKHYQKFDGRPINDGSKALHKFVRKGKTKEGNKYFNRQQNQIYAEKFKQYLAPFKILDSYNPGKDRVKRNFKRILGKEGGEVR